MVLKFLDELSEQKFEVVLDVLANQERTSRRTRIRFCFDFALYDDLKQKNTY